MMANMAASWPFLQQSDEDEDPYEYLKVAQIELMRFTRTKDDFKYVLVTSADLLTDTDSTGHVSFLRTLHDSGSLIVASNDDRTSMFIIRWCAEGRPSYTPVIPPSQITAPLRPLSSERFTPCNCLVLYMSCDKSPGVDALVKRLCGALLSPDEAVLFLGGEDGSLAWFTVHLTTSPTIEVAHIQSFLLEQFATPIVRLHHIEGSNCCYLCVEEAGRLTCIGARAVPGSGVYIESDFVLSHWLIGVSHVSAYQNYLIYIQGHRVGAMILPVTGRGHGSDGNFIKMPPLLEGGVSLLFVDKNLVVLTGMTGEAVISPLIGDIMSWGVDMHRMFGRGPALASQGVDEAAGSNIDVEMTSIKHVEAEEASLRGNLDRLNLEVLRIAGLIGRLNTGRRALPVLTRRPSQVLEMVPIQWEFEIRSTRSRGAIVLAGCISVRDEKWARCLQGSRLVFSTRPLYRSSLYSSESTVTTVKVTTFIDLGESNFSCHFESVVEVTSPGAVHVDCYLVFSFMQTHEQDVNSSPGRDGICLLLKHHTVPTTEIWGLVNDVLLSRRAITRLASECFGLMLGVYTNNQTPLFGNSSTKPFDEEHSFSICVPRMMPCNADNGVSYDELCSTIGSTIEKVAGGLRLVRNRGVRKPNDTSLLMNELIGLVRPLFSRQEVSHTDKSSIQFDVRVTHRKGTPEHLSKFLLCGLSPPLLAMVHGDTITAVLESARTCTLKSYRRNGTHNEIVEVNENSLPMHLRHVSARISHMTIFRFDSTLNYNTDVYGGGVAPCACSW